MISEIVNDWASRRGDGEAVVASGDRWSYGRLDAEAAALAESLRDFAGARVGISTAHAANLATSLIALNRVGASPVLYPATLSASHEHRRQLRLRAEIADVDGLAVNCLEANCDDRPLSVSEDEVLLFTSGTSSPPKPARHTWESLVSAVRNGQSYGHRRWLLTYQPASFAGLQVILQSLLTGGTLVSARSNMPSDVLNVLLSEQVEMASGTPTFWRSLLQGIDWHDLRGCALRQITLGGEAADQPLLDALAGALPHARITHVYASTEMGVCFSVHDGRAGFPRPFLDNASLPCRLRIADDGELMIQSMRRMQGYAGENGRFDDNWFATGDLVELHDDRVLFVGRKSDTIHVGGSKVRPCDVEEVVRSLDCVREVRVYGASSSLTGQIVAAEVQLTADVDEVVARQQILTTCRQRLPKHMIPAVIDITTSPLDTVGGKLARHA